MFCKYCGATRQGEEEICIQCKKRGFLTCGENPGLVVGPGFSTEREIALIQGPTHVGASREKGKHSFGLPLWVFVLCILLAVIIALLFALPRVAGRDKQETIEMEEQLNPILPADEEPASSVHGVEASSSEESSNVAYFPVSENDKRQSEESQIAGEPENQLDEQPESQ